jgi:hypothetical protein
MHRYSRRRVHGLREYTLNEAPDRDERWIRTLSGSSVSDALGDRGIVRVDRTPKRSGSQHRGGRLTFAAVLAAAIAVPAGAAPAPAATSTFSVVPTPSPQIAADGALHGIVCPASGGCLVVGGSEDYNGSGEPFVGRAIGTAWKFATPPVPPLSPKRHADPGGELFAVACATSTKCFAVGEYFDGASERGLIERWNGTSWSISARPIAPGGTSGWLSGIACPTATTCFAVGTSIVSSKSRTFAVRWNGSSWSIVPSANPSNSQASLAGVSCATSVNCVAVGYSRDRSFSTYTLIERWAGKTWSIESTPTPSGKVGNTFGQFSAVSCESSAACFAVGDSGVSPTKTLIARWNGKTWSILPSPNPSDSKTIKLRGISCVGPAFCLAVGFAKSNLVERWNGHAWSMSPSPSAAAIESVVCRSATNCVAVGGSPTESYFGRTEISRWNGATWSTEEAGTSDSALRAVACAGPGSCFALGQYEDAPYHSRALFARWDGTKWSSTAAPTSTGVVEPSSLACPTAKSCFSVLGNTGDGVHPAIDHWDGTSWSLGAGPVPNGGTDAGLRAVSCLSPTSCVAVGGYQTNQVDRTLVEQWNGTAWSVAASPNPAGATNDSLAAVSCPSATTCFAVGTAANQSFTDVGTLVERWNGTAWSIVASPNAGSDSISELTEISCATATTCFAVGFSMPDQSSSDEHPLVEQWNGTTWTIATTSFPAGKGVRVVTDIACPTSTMCLAVAVGSTGRWNGSSWSPVSTDTPEGAAGVLLSSVACATATACFAVGFSFPAHVTHDDGLGSESTLAERYA